MAAFVPLSVPLLVTLAPQSLGDGVLEAERMFEGEPEKSLVAAILWAFDVSFFSCVPDAQRGERNS